MQKKKTFPEINQEYHQLCAELGHAQHTINQLEDQISRETMRIQKCSGRLKILSQQAMAAKDRPETPSQTVIPPETAETTQTMEVTQ